MGSGRDFCEDELNYTGCELSSLTARTQLKQDASNRVQKWNVGPEHRKERETFCGCFGKRTPFLRLRAQLKQDARNLIQKQKTNYLKRGKQNEL